MENDNYLLKVKKNIDNISKDKIEGYINSSNSWYDQLIEAFSNSINSVNYADWNDDVKDKVDDNYLSVINMIKYCKSYNEDVLKPFSVELEVLKEKLKRYYESNINIEALDEEINTIINNGQEALEMLYSNLDNWALNYDTFLEQLNTFYRPREEFAADLELLNEKTQQIHVEIFDDNFNREISQRAKGDMLKKSLEQYYEPRYLYDASYEAIRVEKETQLELEKNVTNSLEKECYDEINKLKSILDSVKKINVQNITTYTSSKTQFKGLGEQAINVTYEKVDDTPKKVEKVGKVDTGVKVSGAAVVTAGAAGVVTTNVKQTGKQSAPVVSTAASVKKEEVKVNTSNGVKPVIASSGAVSGGVPNKSGAAVVTATGVATAQKAQEEKSEDKKTGSKIHFIATGCSDAILIESNGQYGLVDASNPYMDGTPCSAGDGVSDSYMKNPATESVDHVKRYLKAHGVEKLDFVVATHNHSDHIGGMSVIADNFVKPGTKYYYRPYIDVGENIHHPSWANSIYYNKAINAMSTHGATLVNVTSQYPIIKLGDFTVQLLNTEPITQQEIDRGSEFHNTWENKNSIIQLITYKGLHKTVLSADMEFDDEEKLKNIIGKVSVLKLGHHSCNTASSIGYLKSLSPKDVIVTNSRLEKDNSIAEYYLQSLGGKIHLTGSMQQISSGSCDSVVIDYSEAGYTITPNTPLPTLNVEKPAEWPNWIKVNGYWGYYENGVPVHGCWKQLNNIWYYFDWNGRMITGWGNLSWQGKKNWYYFETNGAMVTGWKQIPYQGSAKWFYFESSGAMVKNTTIKINGDSYTFNNDGVCVAGKGI